MNHPDGQPESIEHSGPRVVLPDEPDIVAPDPLEETRDPSVIRGAAFALLLAGVGAAVWAAFTLLTEYQLGLIAVVVGWLAGYGASLGGRGTLFQGIGAGAAAAGYFAGQIAIVIGIIIASAPAATDPTPVLTVERTSEGTLQLISPDGTTKTIDSDSDDPASQDLPSDKVNQEIDSVGPASGEPTLDALPEGSPDDLDLTTIEVGTEDAGGFPGPLEMLAGMVGIFLVIVQSMFSNPIDFLFLGIAVYQGWRIPAEDE